MFPLRKLDELSPRTRLRKMVRILHAVEIEASRGRGCDAAYIKGVAERLRPAAAALGPEAAGLLGQSAAALEDSLLAGTDSPTLLRSLNVLRNDLLAALGAEPSEWDFLSPETGGLSGSGTRYPISVYLEDIRSPFNVGSIFRTAEAFGAGRILLSPRTPRPDHPRAGKTARGAETVLPWEVCGLSELSGTRGIFALELGGTDIGSFPFPGSGIALIGSEELGLSPEALGLADSDLGRVSIPMSGAKRSLNVSVAFGILMHAWSATLR